MKNTNGIELTMSLLVPGEAYQMGCGRATLKTSTYPFSGSGLLFGFSVTRHVLRTHWLTAGVSTGSVKGQ